jgi:UPF0176 protein
MPVASFYRFAPMGDIRALREALSVLPGLTGTIILADEGVNGTIAGDSDAIDRALTLLRAQPELADLAARRSPGDGAVFGRWKVKIKREIVTFGPPVDARATGTKVAPQDWNAVLTDPGTVTIDTRNGFEIAAGSFAGAVDPGTRAFGDLPAWWAAHRDQLAGKRVAMFCTGGIRCEKASAWLLTQGLTEVLQLDGGILGYLQQVPAADSLWRGGCFVFDGRGALGHGLQPVGLP